MGRIIGAVIVGYLVMAIFLFASFSAAYLTMGADGAFRPGTYDVSALWIVTSLVLGIIAAVLGGFVCAAIGKSSKATVALVVLVLVLGFLSALPVLTGSESGELRVR